jgi:hypothetical protein
MKRAAGAALSYKVVDADHIGLIGVTLPLPL